MNFNKLKKAELLWLCNHRCKHGHTYIEHPKCIEKELGDQFEPTEYIGFLDLECSNLDADFGLILSYALKEYNGNVFSRIITPTELKSSTQDKALVAACIADVERFDRIVTFYGARFDIPFLRSRAMVHNLHFPEYGTIRHTDIWFWVRSKMKLHRRRLQVVCDFLEIPSKEHKLDGQRWVRALTGDKEALKWIYDHNIEDVDSTEKVFEALLPFHRLTNTCM